MQFVFQFSFFWKEKCHVQSPDPLCPLKLHETVCRSSQSLVLFFFFFFACFFCMHFHVIDSPLPLLRVSSARPHLSLYSVTYSIQGESSYHLSEIFQTGLSLLICICGAGNPQNWFTFIVLSPTVLPRPDFLHSRRDYWVLWVKTRAGAFVSLLLFFTLDTTLKKKQCHGNGS